MHRQIAGRLTGPTTKWIVLVATILLAFGFAILGGKLAEVKDNEASSWVPSTAESTKVSNEISDDVNPNDIPTLVVYHRDSGLTEADFAAMDEQAEEIGNVEGITDAGVLTPNAARALQAQGENVPDLVSEDGEVAYVYFVLNFGKDGWNKIGPPVDEIKEVAKLEGADVYVGGFGGQASDFIESFENSHFWLLALTFLAVIVILVFTYRSPILWILPILSAGIANVMAGGVVYLMARYADLTVNDQSQYILSILVIGAGTDYALLLVARYREELRRHEDRHEAMAFALHRAAPAIIASAATVVIGLMCLAFADLNSTASLGPVLAVGVAVTLLVMVVFLPALLVILGRWIFWPKLPTFGSDEPTQTGLWAKMGQRISVRPRAIWIVTAVILAIASLGLFRLDATGLSTEDSFTEELNSIKAQKLLAGHGLADNSNTLQVVAEESAAADVQQAVGDVEGVGKPSDLRPLSDGRVWFEAPLTEDMASHAAWDVVENARDTAHGVDGAEALVGGAAAFYLDTKTSADRDTKVIIPIVLVVVLLILMVLLRALLAPVLLLGTVVLSFGAALGLSALLFHYVFGFEGADAGFPLFSFVFLVALGVDYNIFLMTRVREETLHRGTREGSLVALSSTGGVITSAGLVLAATFLVLATLPFVFLVELGVAVALGVLLDTMIVRSVLVTALNLDLGSKIWWPSKLDRGEPIDPDAINEWEPASAKH
ncbi:MMPL family transporter [Nocardioides speluncae]|uniref:MMPL family transporter n=1 Tax=Nocardioides speluncae TaxID=2670337 RepID=UPI000D69AC95|nr:MMPL family transporter [Nocardioides speluncae]